MVIEENFPTDLTEFEGWTLVRVTPEYMDDGDGGQAITGYKLWWELSEVNHLGVETYMNVAYYGDKRIAGVHMVIP